MYQLLSHSVTLHFTHKVCVYGFHMYLRTNSYYFSDQHYAYDLHSFSQIGTEVLKITCMYLMIQRIVICSFHGVHEMDACGSDRVYLRTAPLRERKADFHYALDFHFLQKTLRT
jgi:hypothetical protein